jgi:ketosteroid isomerase-like protein
MKTILLLAGSLVWEVALGQPGPAASVAPASRSEDREAVEKASLAWLAAFNQRDMSAFSSFIDDGYVGTADDGTVSGKERLVKFVGARKPEWMQRKDRHDSQVRPDGDVAIVTYKITSVHQWGSTAIEHLLQRTEVFRRKAGKWVVIAAHESPIPRNYFQALETDPKVLGEYVGTYDWPRHQDSERDRLTVENGRLMSEWRGDRRECLRMGKDTFFNRDDTGWFVFDRDTAGRVTGYTYYYADGQPVSVKRIE